MNIRDIMTQTGSFIRNDKGNGVINGLVLSIGKKGQVVEGVIKGVADQISISFNMLTSSSTIKMLYIFSSRK